MKNLLDKWSRPDSPSERVQLTIRLSEYDFCRIKALHGRFPKRTINDLISGLVNAGLNELEDIQ